MRSRPKGFDRRTFLAACGSALLCAGAPAHAAGAAPLTVIGGDAFGTGWSVSLPAGTDPAGLQARLAALLGEVDGIFSPWRTDSLVGRFNAGEDDAMAVPDELADVVGTGLRIAAQSGGRFDPTVGPLVARWGFGPIRGGEPPAHGWRGIRAGDGLLARADRALTLDLCGIAKGHALDRMVALLLDAGHDSFLVDLGGELAARGSHPSGRPWQVGIEDPRSDADGLAGILALRDMAVATSGDRANGYDLGGRRYSHIVDPETREPVASPLASVSVLMPTACEADGWATALMAAGADGPRIARGRGIAALFQFRDGDGVRSVATGTLARHLA